MTYLGPSHPLADVARRHCRAHGPMPYRIGHVACGACWELAIRDDERVVVEHGLPRELVPDPVYVDEVAVRQACRGERVRLTVVERAEAIRLLYGRGLTRAQVAARLRMASRDVPDPTGAAVVALPVPAGLVRLSRSGRAA